jgi:hypothetical protein
LPVEDLFRLTRWEILAQAVNHSTLRRGQIISMTRSQRAAAQQRHVQLLFGAIEQPHQAYKEERKQHVKTAAEGA